MYCPKCFNDTLKISSSGVVKLTFNGKAKATSQFYYNLAEDDEHDIYDKLENVVKDYFSYYGNFQNKDPIKEVEAFSIDFKCSNGCVVDVNNRVNVIGLIFNKSELKKALTTLAPKYDIPLQLEF